MIAKMVDLKVVAKPRLSTVGLITGHNFDTSSEMWTLLGFRHCMDEVVAAPAHVLEAVLEKYSQGGCFLHALMTQICSNKASLLLRNYTNRDGLRGGQVW